MKPSIFGGDYIEISSKLCARYTCVDKALLTRSRDIESLCFVVDCCLEEKEGNCLREDERIVVLLSYRKRTLLSLKRHSSPSATKAKQSIFIVKWIILNISSLRPKREETKISPETTERILIRKVSVPFCMCVRNKMIKRGSTIKREIAHCSCTGSRINPRFPWRLIFFSK